MALNAAQNTLKAAALVYLIAHETYIDTLSAGDTIRYIGLDDPAASINDDKTRATAAGNTRGSLNNMVVTQHIDDGDTPVVIPNPGGLTIPLAWYVTNELGDL